MGDAEDAGIAGRQGLGTAGWRAATGAVEPGALSHPETDDLLDDLAEIVLRRQGQVVVVPAERMPSATGLAATYRY
jgi:hypothetical protein